MHKLYIFEKGKSDSIHFLGHPFMKKNYFFPLIYNIGMVISVSSLKSMLLRVFPSKVLKPERKGTVTDMTAKTVLFYIFCFTPK